MERRKKRKLVFEKCADAEESRRQKKDGRGENGVKRQTYGVGSSLVS